MLKRLYIRNYAIISELDIPISDGLTIITGETGAGKSILVGALSLVLGKRADSSVLYNENEKCIVEADFDISNYSLEVFFNENDLDYEPVSTIRREINAQGKSRAFVNDTPVNLSQLKLLAANLIDIHSQHEVLTLKTADFRTRFLDLCSDTGVQYNIYALAFGKWKKLKANVEDLKGQLQKASAEEDYLRFQLNELEEVDLKEGELSVAKERLNTLENSEEIRTSLAQINAGLSGSDNSFIDSLRSIELELERLARKFSAAEEWASRVKASLIDLQDVAETIDLNLENVDEDPVELERLQERVDEILRLLTKHRKNSDEELIAFQFELSDQLQSINNSDEQLTLLNAELERAEVNLNSEAGKLTKLRSSAAKSLAPIITSELQMLGMPDAKVEISLINDQLTQLGQDRIEILFSANKGQGLEDISKVASGGELSRLMLSIKSEMAKNTQLPAIIFDEVDTGVSGEVAGKMGSKIRDLSAEMQVFCITHLPQIASKGNQHLFVYKEEEQGRTVTRIRELEKSERIVEIAKMLSNSNPTDAALQHAKNLVNEK